MNPSMQIPLPPTPLNRVGNAAERPAKKVGITLVAAVLRAAGRIGLSDKELAGIFRLPPADFSKAFSMDYPERNRPMKEQLTLDLMRELANVLIDESGMREQAQAELVESLVRLVVVNQR